MNGTGLPSLLSMGCVVRLRTRGTEHPGGRVSVEVCVAWRVSREVAGLSGDFAA